MYNSTRTIYNINLQISMMRGAKYEVLPNTTLNEKFNVLPEDRDLKEGEYPLLKYLAIGNGGLPLINDYETSIKFNQHKAIDGALYNHVPFIVREVDNDISKEERLNYRFRVRKTINDKDYYLYFLKVIESFENNKIVKINTKNDTATLSYFNPLKYNILNPKPGDVNTYITDKQSEAVGVTATAKFYFTTDELKEIKKGMDILYGDGNYLLTEMAMCTGLDVEQEDKTFELKTAQIGYFIPVNYDLQSFIINEKPFLKNIELGGLEPIMIHN